MKAIVVTSVDSDDDDDDDKDSDEDDNDAMKVMMTIRQKTLIALTQQKKQKQCQRR